VKNGGIFKVIRVSVPRQVGRDKLELAPTVVGGRIGRCDIIRTHGVLEGR